MGNTPNVRFKGFTEDWKQRKLKDVIIDAYQGINTTADKVMYSNEGIPVLQAKHITTGSIDFTDVRYLKKEQYSEYFPKYTPQKGDMLFANIGTIGPSTIVENQGEFLIAWNILRIVFNKNLVDAYFVHLIFDKYKDSGYFERMQTGNATKFINKDNIFDINLFMPSEVEQHKIGGYFRNLDYLITLHQQKCVEIKKLKKYMLQNMFPQKDEKVPKIRFAGFTGDWEQHKLSELTTMHARIGWQNLRTSEFLDSGDYMLITGTDFNDGAIDYSTCHYVEKERYEQDKNIQIRNGSILITKDGTLGKVAYVQGLTMPATLNAGVFNVEIKDENIADEKYLYQYLKAPFLMDYVSKKATGGTIKHLNQSILVDFPIAMPKKEEQVEIGNYFQSLDHLITLHQQKCAALKEFKKYMLQNMFPQKGENKCQN